MQSETLLERAPTISARGTPKGLEYRWESFAKLAREFLPLFKQHWKEIALHQDDIPLDPDWDRYFQHELAGVLHVLTVWDTGTLVGYIFVMVYPHLHYASTRFAATDMFWLHPAYRNGWAGVRMFKHLEYRMRMFGVKVLMANYKLHFEKERGGLDKFFRRLGYKPTDMVVTKLLE